MYDWNQRSLNMLRQCIKKKHIAGVIMIEEIDCENKC